MEMNIRKKPTGKRGMIFSQVKCGNEDMYLIAGDNFNPIYDGTDHFEFECPACHSVADVLNVEMRNYRRKNSFDLYFFIECPKCKRSGQRKIYLDRNQKFEYDCEPRRTLGMKRGVC